MKEFNYFLKVGDVRKVARDIELARSLVKDMNERIEKANLLDADIFAKMIFENFYDALRDFSDAILAVNGFKAYSHQASIVYLKKFGFGDSVLMEFDGFRYKRNSSKYYGEIIYPRDSKNIKEFFERIRKDVERVLGELGV